MAAGLRRGRLESSARLDLGWERSPFDPTQEPLMADGPQSKPGSIPDFSDFTRIFSEMKMPAMPDMEAFVSASRRNMETITAANRVALEGAQAVARRHMEIMQQAVSE